MDSLPPGAQLGQYRLLEAASQGGFGILYRAWDEKLNRPVAVKECFPASICQHDPQTGMVRPRTPALQRQYETALDSMYEEAQTLASLHHARVVPVYDVFRAAGGLFYVMPWLEGGSLREKMAAAQAGGPPIAAQELRRWLPEILSALEYLHSKKVIHRDVKPGNIMFDTDGNPVLVDFGSALNRATKVDTTTQGEFSPVYASPEQVSGKGKIGPWTDLYSLAATWYELISGSPPEPAQQRLAKDDLQPLPCGETVLEQSLMQNLALNPAERCQSAREWQDWLLSGALPVAIARPRRRRFLWWGLASAGVALGTFLLGRGQAEPAGNAEPAAAAPTETLRKHELPAEQYEQMCRDLGLPALVQQYNELMRKATAYHDECRERLETIYRTAAQKAKTQAHPDKPHKRAPSISALTRPKLSATRQIFALQLEYQGKMADYISEQETRVIRPMQTRMQEMPRVLPCNTEQERAVSEQAARRIKADYATYLSTAPLEQMMKSFVDLCSERMKELQQIPNPAANAK